MQKRRLSVFSNTITERKGEFALNSSIQLFNNNDFYVRSFNDNGEIWFVAKDIAQALEYSEAGSITTLFGKVPEIWKGSKPIATPGGVQEMLCLTEQGLYFFLGRSDKEKALPYQVWIAGDVVPSIRRTGYYSVRPSNEDIELKRQELETRNRELDIKQQELNLRKAEFVREMLDNPPFPITPETRTVFAHEVYRLTSGHECLTMLPECTDKWYTATDIGSVLGISAQKVGRIANKYGIKPPEGQNNQYGRWIMSKSKYSAREVPSFIYSGNGLEWFREHKAVIA